MPSDQTRLEIAREGHFRFCLRPAQSVPDHVVEPATQYVLALQTARQEVGPHQPFAQGEEPVGEDEVVIPPTAAVQPLAIPAHGRVEGLHETEQGKEGTRRAGPGRSRPTRSG